MMKMTLRLTSLLFALLLCCAVFLTACTNPDGKDASTEEQASESKAPRGSYKLRYLSNGDGTCIVTGIEHTEDAANLTLVIPEVSPNGEKVTGYLTDALSFANIPLYILEEDFINHIQIPLQQAVERGELSQFLYDKFIDGFFFEKSLENEKTDLAKKALLQNYPITEVADIYEFYPYPTYEEKIFISQMLSLYADYGADQRFEDAKRMLPFYDLPVNSDAFVAISLPNTLESINSYAFYSCNPEAGTVLDNVLYFGNESNPYLMLCKTLDTSITSVVMPSSVKFVGGSAFYNCKNLESVSIAESVKDLGISAFEGCNALKSVVIPERVAILRNFAFKNCTSLESIVVPSSVKVLEDYVFENADNLKSVVFSQWVHFLGIGVFFDCDSLSEVVIPKSVMTMGESMFAHCSKLTHIYYEGTAEEWENIKVEIVNGDENGELPLYYYSETQPTAAGNYWRYVDGVPTAW